MLLNNLIFGVVIFSPALKESKYTTKVVIICLINNNEEGRVSEIFECSP